MRLGKAVMLFLFILLANLLVFIEVLPRTVGESAGTLILMSMVSSGGYWLAASLDLGGRIASRRAVTDLLGNLLVQVPLFALLLFLVDADGKRGFVATVPLAYALTCALFRSHDLYKRLAY